MKYKFTRVYVVEGMTQQEALEKCRKNPSKHLTFQSTVIEDGEPTVKKPWLAVARQQVTGK
ncbi:MAG: hypothetical protein M3Y27_03405 [Acidobacteriota bacterium]|nr:hypothetical protein [Acidobacteriota bacterium]